MQSGVDHLHAGVPQRRGDNLRASVMAIEPGFRDEYADGSIHSPSSRTRRSRGGIFSPTGSWFWTITESTRRKKEDPSSARIPGPRRDDIRTNARKTPAHGN